MCVCGTDGDREHDIQPTRACDPEGGEVLVPAMNPT